MQSTCEQRAGVQLWTTLRPLFLVVLSIFMVLMMILINILQILSLPVALISRPYQLRFHSVLADSIWRVFQFSFESVNCSNIQYTGDAIEYGKSACVISNHCGYADFYLIHHLAEQAGMLGCCKYFAKFVPFFGWGMWMLGCVFLKRNWLSDQEKITKRLRKFVQMQIPIWFVSYPEGSRFTQAKKTSSQKFCKEHSQPVLENVLFPRSKGFIATVQAFRRSHAKILYDVTIGYYHPTKGYGFPPDLVAIHIAGIPNGSKHFINVKKYLVEDLPDDDDGLTAWLAKRFVEKDKLIQSWKDSTSQ